MFPLFIFLYFFLAVQFLCFRHSLTSSYSEDMCLVLFSLFFKRRLGRFWFNSDYSPQASLKTSNLYYFYLFIYFVPLKISSHNKNLITRWAYCLLTMEKKIVPLLYRLPDYVFTSICWTSMNIFKMKLRKRIEEQIEYLWKSQNELYIRN